MGTIDTLDALAPHGQRRLIPRVEWNREPRPNKTTFLRSFLGTTIPTHLSPIDMVNSDLQRKFIVPVLQKCIIGAESRITFDSGLIFG
jgi:hypothetical protein